MSLSVGPQIPSWSAILVATPPPLCFFLFFLLGAESDDDESDESDDDGSGSRFTLGLCLLLRFELFTDRVILSSSSQVISNQVSIFLIFPRLIFSRSNAFLVSNSESLINFQYANFSLVVSLSP